MPEHYRVIIQPRASQDMIGICTYIERDSPQNAAGVARELIDAIDSLELLPHRYRVRIRRRKPAGAVRCMPVSSFMIYYQVVDAERVVMILTVRHGAQRQPRRLD